MYTVKKEILNKAMEASFKKMSSTDHEMDVESSNRIEQVVPSTGSVRIIIPVATVIIIFKLFCFQYI